MEADPTALIGGTEFDCCDQVCVEICMGFIITFLELAGSHGASAKKI